VIRTENADSFKPEKQGGHADEKEIKPSLSRMEMISQQCEACNRVIQQRPEYCELLQDFHHCSLRSCPITESKRFSDELLSQAGHSFKSRSLVLKSMLVTFKDT
jgi:hypothetical protein